MYIKLTECHFIRFAPLFTDPLSVLLQMVPRTTGDLLIFASFSFQELRLNIEAPLRCGFYPEMINSMNNFPFYVPLHPYCQLYFSLTMNTLCVGLF